jgi:hypothetical protein
MSLSIPVPPCDRQVIRPSIADFGSPASARARTSASTAV